MLFCDADGELKVLPDDGFPTEKDLQTFVERHLDTLLQLRFIATEFVVNEHNRIDTLAYDEESNAFVAIEDKNVRNSSLVDQGFAYLSAILDRKEKLVLKFNLVTGESRTERDFEWSQSRIVFISPEFTERQISATSFGDMPFELYELRKYGNTYSWRNLTKKIRDKTPRPSMSKKHAEVNDPLSDIKVYSEDDIIDESSPAYSQYLQIKEKVMELSDVSISVLKSGIKFKINGKRFGEINERGVGKTKFDVLIANGDLIKDPTGILIDISNRKWGNLKHRIIVEPGTDVDAVFYLLKQSYEITKRGE